ncbi:MAG: hypothetical protein GEU82_18445 [Luteitalea sp.]|nr:hypothetical protein [Luteitalea sp.]
MARVSTVRSATLRAPGAVDAAEADAPPSASRVISLPPRRAVRLPLLLSLALVGFGFVDPIRQSTPLLWSIFGAAAALTAWTAGLFLPAVGKSRVFRLEISLRKQHYLQACAQGSVLLYWGWYWPQAHEWAPLVAAQLLFAYGFDVLLAWSRQRVYQLGFGPFPVIFSINLFLWFKPEWFYLQFLMVALGFLAKQLFRWDKDGHRTHIFNPSAFTLAVFSTALLASGTTGITWGPEIAITQFYPPHIYVVLFLIGLPGQLFFGVTSMTMAAVVTTYLFSLLYFAVTGIFFFYDSYIPIAVFLGMHLLFTDPSTAPRTELGRLIFGVLYGLSTVALYALLGNAGLPTFYDKLLQVPILNLSIKLIDRAARSTALGWLDPTALGRSLAPRQRNLAYLSLWIIVFAAINAAQGVGDRHPGQWLPFWQRACAEGRPAACSFVSARLATHCGEGSGWACNEVGIRRLAVSPSNAGQSTSRARPGSDAPAASFERGCELGFAPSCDNLLRVVSGSGALDSAAPTLADYPIILRGSKNQMIALTPSGLLAAACEQGWPGTCGPDDQAGAHLTPQVRLSASARASVARRSYRNGAASALVTPP